MSKAPAAYGAGKPRFRRLMAAFALAAALCLCAAPQALADTAGQAPEEGQTADAHVGGDHPADDEGAPAANNADGEGNDDAPDAQGGEGASEDASGNANCDEGVGGADTVNPDSSQNGPENEVDQPQGCAGTTQDLCGDDGEENASGSEPAQDTGDELAPKGDEGLSETPDPQYAISVKGESGDADARASELDAPRSSGTGKSVSSTPEPQGAGCAATAAAQVAPASQNAKNPQVKSILATVKTTKALGKLTVENAIYTGKPITPKITVKSGNKKLKKGVDYTVSIVKNVKVGKATVTVTGIGAYTGKLSKKFTIFGKPVFAGATMMPVASTCLWTLENARIKILKGKKYLTFKGKKAVAKKKGTAKLAIYNKLGKKVATKKVKVVSFMAGVKLRLDGNSKGYLEIADDSVAENAKAQVNKKRSSESQDFLLKRSGNGYQIKSVSSGMLLQPKGNSKRAGATIVQRKATGNANQKWKITVDAKNKLTFVNVATKKALSVSKDAQESAKSNSTAEMPAVIQQSDENAATQKWNLVIPSVKCSGGTVLPLGATSPWNLKNAKLVITKGADKISFKRDAETGKTNLLAKKTGRSGVKVYNAIGDLVLKSNISVYRLSGDYYVTSVKDPGKTLDLDMTEVIDPTTGLSSISGNLRLMKTKGAENQKFIFARQADNSYLIKTKETGQVIVVENGPEAVEGNIAQAKKTGSDYERWNIVVDANNMLQFVNKATGKALAIEGGKAKSKANIAQSPVESSSSQKFNLISLKLLQTPADSKQNAIALAAAKYSYSLPVYYQHNLANRGTPLYRMLCELIFEHYEPLSCDRGVAAAMRWTGADEDYPASCNKQYPYLMNSSKWKYLGRWSGNEADLQPGDVLIRTKDMKEKDKKTKSNHTCIYVGSKIIQQVYSKNLKGTAADMGAPALDATFVSAHRSKSNRDQATAACIGNAKFAHADSRMVVFRCLNKKFSTKYANIS